MVGNVPPDLLFVEADRGDKVSDAPDAAVNVYLPHELEPAFDPEARFDFECLHDGCNSDVRRYFDLDVYMIFVGIERMDVERRILLDYRVTGGLELFFDVLLQPFPSVASSPYEVILRLVCAVIQLPDSHGTSVPPPSAVCT